MKHSEVARQGLDVAAQGRVYVWFGWCNELRIEIAVPCTSVAFIECEAQFILIAAVSLYD